VEKKSSKMQIVKQEGHRLKDYRSKQGICEKVCVQNMRAVLQRYQTQKEGHMNKKEGGVINWKLEEDREHAK